MTASKFFRGLIWTLVIAFLALLATPFLRDHTWPWAKEKYFTTVKGEIPYAGGEPVEFQMEHNRPFRFTLTALPEAFESTLDQLEVRVQFEDSDETEFYTMRAFMAGNFELKPIKRVWVRMIPGPNEKAKVRLKRAD